MKKYNVIYADPPWSYDVKKTGGTNFNSSASNKYDLLSNEEIFSLPIDLLTEKNCVLFIWATAPLLDIAFECIEKWGFEYKTIITWRKIMSMGMGYWFRGQCEFLLLAKKGKVKAFRQQKSNFFESEIFDLDRSYQSRVGKHSQKPAYFRDLISEAVKVSFPNPKKLELFARSREGMFPDMEYEGWDVFGNQVNNSIELPKINNP